MKICMKQLTEYGVSHGLIEPEDRSYIINQFLDLLGLDTYEDPGEVEEIDSPEKLETVLGRILDYAVEKEIISEDVNTFRDLFDTKVMNVLVPRPSEIIHKFWERYQSSPKEATDYFYDLSRASDYIRTYRISRDKKWVVDTPYGQLDITINLSKPEKDPKMIALMKTVKASSYPKCMLCPENEGYAGRIDHPARNNHRIIPLEINNSSWGFQYSPYVYYNEHCIVFNQKHVPMEINRDTFVKLFDFVKQFPHYFLGSNADLPIVGGSILSHDHFQGGRYTFAMEKAPIEQVLQFKGYQDVTAGIVKWPMSVIRLSCEDKNRIIELADVILKAWRSYTDEAAFIFAETDGEMHNTITPIARMREGKFEMDLVLRNNITTEEHPDGLYHPWAIYHNIKKENIGLIEVMGLAVLPARLKEELLLIREAILSGKDIREDERIQKHADWVQSFLLKYDDLNEKNTMTILENEVGIVFQKVLECAGVFKRTKEGKEAFLRFTDSIFHHS